MAALKKDGTEAEGPLDEIMGSAGRETWVEDPLNVVLNSTRNPDEPKSKDF